MNFGGVLVPISYSYQETNAKTKEKTLPYRIILNWPDTVAHTCKPSYLEDIDQNDHGSRSAYEKFSRTPFQQTSQA
jgi:hypothetical protein